MTTITTVAAHFVRNGLPGVEDAPLGFVTQRQPPQRMTVGDLVLLGGLVRTVRRVAHGKRTGRLAIVLDPAEGAETDIWFPLTGDLPIAIWRPGTKAARVVVAAPAVNSAVPLDLLERVLEGLRAMPTGTHDERKKPPPANAAQRPYRLPELAATRSCVETAQEAQCCL